MACRREQFAKPTEQLPGLSVIASEARVESQGHGTIGEDKEGPALLERVALHSRLSKTAPQGTNKGEKYTKIESRAQTSTSPQGSVAVELGVGDNSAPKLELVAKCPRLPCPTVAQDEDPRSRAFDLRDVLAQLRDLLTAEQSAKVANGQQEQRLLSQVFAEGVSMPVDILDAALTQELDARIHLHLDPPSR